jgi:hypothetical protein
MTTKKRVVQRTEITVNLDVLGEQCAATAVLDMDDPRGPLGPVVVVVGSRRDEGHWAHGRIRMVGTGTLTEHDLDRLDALDRAIREAL